MQETENLFPTFCQNGLNNIITSWSSVNNEIWMNRIQNFIHIIAFKTYNIIHHFPFLSKFQTLSSKGVTGLFFAKFFVSQPRREKLLQLKYLRHFFASRKYLISKIVITSKAPLAKNDSFVRRKFSY